MSSAMYRLTWDGTVRSEKKIATFYGHAYIDKNTGNVYRQLAYIKKTGIDVYFPTGYSSINQDTRIVIDTKSSDTGHSLFGAYVSNGNYFNLTASSNKERFRWGASSTYIDTTTAYRTTRCVFDCYKGIKITNQSTGAVLFNKYNTLSGTFTVPVEIWVGCRQQNGGIINDAMTEQTIYSIQIYNNETELVRDLVPVLNIANTSEIGFFDKVNMVFYKAEKTTGTFSSASRQLKSITKVRTGQVVKFSI